MRPALRLAILAAALACPGAALAFHDVDARDAGWTLVPWLAALLAASALLYALGVRALWRKAGPGRGLGGPHVARFAAGWIVLVLALLSPLDALAARSFALHMVQHELLMAVAAPLLVLGRPLEAWAWALPRPSQRTVGALGRSQAFAATWRALTGLRGAWIVHAAAIWVWHAPPLFRAALADNGLHVLQHVIFLASALAFWWSVLSSARTGAAPALASVFTTMLHTGALGAILTFAPTPWYADAPTALGISALEDQQLGGLIMWAPGGVAYLVAALALTARLLSPPSPRPRLRTAD